MHSLPLVRSPSYDYHWMAYEDRSCRWSDIIDNDNTPERNNFQIRRHSLQILQPVNEDGELQCLRNDGRNSFPRLDYSKGFPDWWHLSHTEITVPSEHFQEGKQYDAEVHLAHFYEIDHERQMGKVAIFLQADPNRNRWPFLDKLICQWREVEEQTREDCGLASVPAYPGCRNPDRSGGNPTLPPVAPVVSPTPNPVPPTTFSPSPSNSPADASPTPLPVARTSNPVASPTDSSNGVVCSDYNGHPTINIARICKAGGCCVNPRSASNHCHSVYNFFGEDMNDVCSDCCNPAKELGPVTPPHPEYPSIDCTTVDNPFRMCKPNSCCESTPSDSSYCTGVYDTFGNEMPSVCWYCCSEPKDIGSAGPVQPTPTLTTLSPLPPPVTAPVLTAPPTPPIPPTTPSPLPPPVTAPVLTAPPTPPTPPTPTPVAPPTNTDGIVCSDYDGHPTINIGRICKAGGCCDPIRSSSDHCHSTYEFFEDSMASVCSDCCSPSKQLAPPPPDHPTYLPIQCSLVDNPYRICKPNSCCEPVKSLSSHCQGVYDTYGDDMGSVCWYCCSEPKEVDPTVLSSSRKLELLGKERRNDEDSEINTATEEEVRHHDLTLDPGFYASEFKMHPSNFEVNENLEEEYLSGIEEYHNLREDEEDAAHRRLNGDNYEDVQYR
jgi:hypothetical protein